MANLSFLNVFNERGESNATLRAVLPSGEIRQISERICPFKLLGQCPLLYHAFEYGSQSRLQASVEVRQYRGLDWVTFRHELPPESRPVPNYLILIREKYAVVALLRYCYTGNYLPDDAEYGPILLLPHAQTYKMSEDYDVPELQLLAHGNFSCQIDFACCMPTIPQDLFGSIRFVYQHYSSQQARRQHGLVSTLLNYCISVFIQQKLGENVDFLKLAAELPEFCQDLCRTNMERNFEDACALDIIRLCLSNIQDQPCIRPTTLASRDLPQEMICDTIPDAPFQPKYEPIADEDIDFSGFMRESENGNIHENMVDSVTAPLVHRPRVAQPAVVADMKGESSPGIQHIESDFSDDECGFTVVSRPKPYAPVHPEEPMSSPTPVVDILKATGTDYSDDDDWTML